MSTGTSTPAESGAQVREQAQVTDPSAFDTGQLEAIAEATGPFAHAVRPIVEAIGPVLDELAGLVDAVVSEVHVAPQTAVNGIDRLPELMQRVKAEGGLDLGTAINVLSSVASDTEEDNDGTNSEAPTSRIDGTLDTTEIEDLQAVLAVVAPFAKILAPIVLRERDTIVALANKINESLTTEDELDKAKVQAAADRIRTLKPDFVTTIKAIVAGVTSGDEEAMANGLASLKGLQLCMSPKCDVYDVLHGGEFDIDEVKRFIDAQFPGMPYTGMVTMFASSVQADLQRNPLVRLTGETVTTDKVLKHIFSAPECSEFKMVIQDSDQDSEDGTCGDEEAADDTADADGASDDAGIREVYAVDDGTGNDEEVREVNAVDDGEGTSDGDSGDGGTADETQSKTS